MKRWLLILAGGLLSVTGIGLETVVSDEVIDELLVLWQLRHHIPHGPFDSLKEAFELLLRHHIHYGVILLGHEALTQHHLHP